ncbi:hypothetical protein PZE06_21815 [Robertmurraya sp. DFI.2.37]|uniref:hypothetical protein n=1 Tax=Robertmurraya sp. DFI.2.37 TaxID=3031819 RepID=UPI0012473548|nr:hypothetical protein [Robertmurraya sp. DFI.2.37]MDF1510775.1 hypothetical protein [Robertmurraya sp. DFI.2.37]
MNNQAKLNESFEKLAKGYRKLNKKQQEFAIREIGRIRGDLADMLADYSAKDGTIKRQRLARLLRELDEMEMLVREYGTTSLDAIVKESAEFGSTGANAAIVAAIRSGALSEATIERINRDVFEYATKRLGDDGLVLSDRVWRFGGDMRDELSKVLRADIIRGESVSTMIANIRKVYENETWKIRRLVVTEGNTAYRAAISMSADRSDVVKGVRLHRGAANVPSHRCTILSLEDRYGMGEGVFKSTDTEIYHPHINCTSFLTYELYDKYL